MLDDSKLSNFTFRFFIFDCWNVLFTEFHEDHIMGHAMILLWLISGSVLKLSV